MKPHSRAEMSVSLLKKIVGDWSLATVRVILFEFMELNGPNIGIDDHNRTARLRTVRSCPRPLALVVVNDEERSSGQQTTSTSTPDQNANKQIPATSTSRTGWISGSDPWETQ